MSASHLPSTRDTHLGPKVPSDGSIPIHSPALRPTSIIPVLLPILRVHRLSVPLRLSIRLWLLRPICRLSLRGTHPRDGRVRLLLRIRIRERDGRLLLLLLWLLVRGLGGNGGRVKGGFLVAGCGAGGFACCKTVSGHGGWMDCERRESNETKRRWGGCADDVECEPVVSSVHKRRKPGAKEEGGRGSDGVTGSLPF